ncbi:MULTISPECIES: C40 family peptidase [unclassified Romboutsia]|uniref:C40 family peptidase n=1 Tax=unclassified Romboutsia TaxID=2626894 RepID=UPI000822FB22|nr:MULTISPECIES: C40 family peptidase [unclassified Romboutsia]SCI34075.1 Probable endopeptidase cgR_2070 precursor [uncultured Clostridium sp.]
MKRKILVPMFASVMAISSMTAVVNADEVKPAENIEDKTSQGAIDLDEYKEITYKKATVKDGVAVKIRNEGSVKLVAYTGDEFKVLATQGDWVEVSVGDEKGWIPSRYVDVESASAFVTEEKVNFRKESNTDSEIIEELTKGTELQVVEVQDEWIKVKNGEEEGYVNANYVSDEAPVIEEVVVEDQAINTVSTTQNSNSNIQTTNNVTNNTTNNATNNTSSNQNSSSSNKIEQSNTNVPAANTSLAQAVVNLAYSKIGSPYVWGAEGPNSFDCSGLTSYVYKNAAGISIPRSSSAQSTYGTTVSKANLQPGDLVFFGSGSVSHVGIYIGGGNMIHSPKPGETVKITSINSSYYTNRFITAKRVL